MIMVSLSLARDRPLGFAERSRPLTLELLCFFSLLLPLSKILAYSAAANLFFSPLLLLSAILCLLRWSITGVISLCTLGAANFCFLPSLRGRGLLITYWHTSSSLVRLNSFLILEALLGPSLRGIVLSVSPGISDSP